MSRRGPRGEPCYLLRGQSDSKLRSSSPSLACDVCRSVEPGKISWADWTDYYVSRLVRRLCVRTRAARATVSLRKPRNLDRMGCSLCEQSGRRLHIESSRTCEVCRSAGPGTGFLGRMGCSRCEQPGSKIGSPNHPARATCVAARVQEHSSWADWAARNASSVVRRLGLRTQLCVRRVSRRRPRNIVPGPNEMLTR